MTIPAAIRIINGNLLMNVPFDIGDEIIVSDIKISHGRMPVVD